MKSLYLVFLALSALIAPTGGYCEFTSKTTVLAEPAQSVPYTMKKEPRRKSGRCPSTPCKLMGELKVKNSSPTRPLFVRIPGRVAPAVNIPPGTTSTVTTFGDPANNVWEDVPCGGEIVIELSTVGTGNPQTAPARAVTYKCGPCPTHDDAAAVVFDPHTGEADEQSDH